MELHSGNHCVLSPHSKFLNGFHDFNSSFVGEGTLSFVFEVTLGAAATTPGVVCASFEWTDSIMAASASVTSSVS